MNRSMPLVPRRSKPRGTGRDHGGPVDRLHKVLALLVVTPRWRRCSPRPSAWTCVTSASISSGWRGAPFLPCGIGGSASPAPTTAIVAASDTRSGGTWSGARRTGKERQCRGQDGGSRRATRAARSRASTSFCSYTGALCGGRRHKSWPPSLEMPADAIQVTALLRQPSPRPGPHGARTTESSNSRAVGLPCCRGGPLWPPWVGKAAASRAARTGTIVPCPLQRALFSGRGSLRISVAPGRAARKAPGRFPRRCLGNSNREEVGLDGGPDREDIPV